MADALAGLRTLRDRLAAALWDIDEQRMAGDDNNRSPWRPYEPCPWADAHPLDHEEYRRRADAVLTTLRLDDLDAAVERVRLALMPNPYPTEDPNDFWTVGYQHGDPDGWRPEAEAALSALLAEDEPGG